MINFSPSRPLSILDLVYLSSSYVVWLLFFANSNCALLLPHLHIVAMPICRYCCFCDMQPTSHTRADHLSTSLCRTPSSALLLGHCRLRLSTFYIAYPAIASSRCCLLWARKVEEPAPFTCAIVPFHVRRCPLLLSLHSTWASSGVSVSSRCHCCRRTSWLQVPSPIPLLVGLLISLLAVVAPASA